MEISAYVVCHRPAPNGSAGSDGPARLAAGLADAGYQVVSRTAFSGVGYDGERLAIGAAGGPGDAGADAAVSPGIANGTVTGVAGRGIGGLRARTARLAAEIGGGMAAAVVPATLADAPKILLVMDVDSTLIKQEVIELLAAHAGREAEVAAVTEAAMRGELDFAQSLHARVATLATLPESVIADVRAAVELSDGARELVAAFHAAGHAVGVVSGGFIQILEPIARELGLDYAIANDLGVEAGALTGTVLGDVVDRETKEASLRLWAAELGIPMEHTIAAGDGANDLAMVRAAGLGIAFNAKPALRQEADAAIDLPRLDIIRHFAGL